jgi:hypothetical protein
VLPNHEYRPGGMSVIHKERTLVWLSVCIKKVLCLLSDSSFRIRQKLLRLSERNGFYMPTTPMRRLVKEIRRTNTQEQ